jgi:hypothetical protein
MTHDPTRDCEHGRLKGKCDVCDLQAEVERLNRVNAELVEFAQSYIEWIEPLIKDIGMQEMERKARAALAKARGETK